MINGLEKRFTFISAFICLTIVNDTRMKLQQLSPILWTKNLQETIAFYTEILGFTSQSHFPNFVSLVKEEVQIMFITPQEEPEECKEPGDGKPFFPGPCLTGSIYIFTEEVDALWDKVKDNSTIKTALADREYLMRDFSILDNNGYEIVFGEDISRK